LKTRSVADGDKPARRVYKSVMVTKHDTIRYVRCGFLLVFYSNFVPKRHRFWDIHWPWNTFCGHSRSSEPTRVDPPSVNSY